MTLLAEEGFLDRFCQECGLDLPIRREQVRSGRNSDVWLLSTTRRRAILKHYFPRERDGRDRLGAEFGFLSYLERHRVQGVAQPIGAAPERGWGLYSWLPGSRPTAITQSYVEQAARFIIEINRFRDSPEAATLPAAADACSSWMSHVQLAQRRLTRLAELEPVSELERDAKQFVTGPLSAAWARIRANAVVAIEPARREARLAPAGRILSPSDFGFHNALDDGGGISFLDFEYAGWDDAAKLICDFRCQPELPVPDSLGRLFSRRVLDGLGADESLRHRVEALMPVHRVKWCGILLNELDPLARLRRSHAGCADDLLAAQLAKASTYFNEHVQSAA